MLDKKERSLLFPDKNMNCSSAGPGAPHLQNTDLTPSSYFIDMNILEETLKNRKVMNLDGKHHPGVSSVLYGNNQYYNKNNFSVGRLAEFENINKGLFSNPTKPYFQQKESSYFHETFKEDVSNLRDTDHIGYARQSDQSGFRSEYSCDLLGTFFLAQDRQPIVLESSKAAYLEKEKLKNNAYTSKELGNIYLGKQEESTTEHSNRPLVDRSLCINASLNSERLAEIGDGFSANLDEQNKPASERISPVTTEKIWDGSLKLNTSTTVPAVAFFKSGEKVQDLNWPAHLEIKGKVRLPAFEKFIQELPRSRNRALMVISLCWKVGSCRSGLAGMMEVAKGYMQTEKVGFAQIHLGIDLYVCPRSDIIITILAKYGFFKGMTAIEEDQDSLIGCVVWRKSQSSTNYVSKDTVGKKTLIEEQPLNSNGLTIRGMNSPSEEARECEKEQGMPSKTEVKAALDLPGSETGTAIALTVSTSSNSQHAITSHCSAVQTLTSSIPYSCPLVPAQQRTSERPLNLLQENVKPADIIPPAQNSGTDETVLVSDSMTQITFPSQISPVFMLGNSLSSSVSQSLGNFGSGTAPGPRPLIPVVSSNFQFQPQLAQKTLSGSGRDSNWPEKNIASSFEATKPSLPGPPPLPLELLHKLIQSNENVPKAIITGEDKFHIMHHIATRGRTNVLETIPPSLPQIQKTCDGSITVGKLEEEEEEEDDDDDLPEFDFDSACGEPEAPISRFPVSTQQTHFPNAPPLNEKRSIESPWSPVDLTPIETSTNSFEALQHRPKPSPLPSKLSDSNEGLSRAKNFEMLISERTPTEGYQLTQDLRKNRRQGFGFERKSLWDDDDDDDDMPEWCPPDLDLPAQPLPNAANFARLQSGRPIPPPDKATPLSFHPCQSHDLPQRSHSGLLGTPFDSPTGRSVQTRPSGDFVQFSKAPLGSSQRDSPRRHSGKFSRRQAPYASDGRRHRR